MQPTTPPQSIPGSFRFTAIGLTLLAGLTAGLGTFNTHAATRTWTGGHASSANWNLRDNWGGVAVPAPGDTLVFPSGAARLFNTNNIPGLRLNAIQFTGPMGGYNLRGLGVTVTNGIVLVEGSFNTVSLDTIGLGGTQAFHVPPGGVLTMLSDIALNGFNLSLAAIGDITMRGAIGGNGNISKSGAGQLSLSGAKDNTFGGSLTIASGTLAMNRFETISLAPLTQVSRIAVPGNLVLGNGSGTAVATAHFEHQIANTGTITINEDATLDFNDHHDTVGDIVLKGGVINTGTGTLTLGGNVTSLASIDSAVINGLLFLGGDCTFSVADGSSSLDLDVRANIGGGIAHITKIGPGTLRFGGTNSYLGMTYVNGGQLNVGNDSALGAANGTTVVSTNAQLLLESAVDTLAEGLSLAGAGMGGTNAALRVVGGATLQYSVTLDAPATMNVPFGSSLSLEGVVSGAGPLKKIGSGTLQLAGNSANTFTGGLIAEQGLLLLNKLAGSAVQGDLVIGTTNSTATARHLRSANLGGSVMVNADSFYDLNGYNESIDNLTLIGGSEVQTGSGQLTVDSTITVPFGPISTPKACVINGRLRLGSAGTAFVTIHPDISFESPYVHLVISARVSGDAPIVKNGAGNVTLSSSNSFTGSFTVENGHVVVTDSHALGSPSGDTFVEGNSRLTLNNNIEVQAERLFLNSAQTNDPAGLGFAGALVNLGSNTWAGPIFLARDATVNVSTNSALNISGVINGLAGLTKVGAGLLIYSGTASNTYIGATRVNEGIMRLGRIGNNRSIPGTLIIGDGLGGDGTDRVELVGPDEQIGDASPVIVNSSGLLRHLLTGAVEVIGSLAGNGRLHISTAGKSLMTGGNGDSTDFDGIISGDGWVNKLGTGTWTLGGSNIHTGGTIVGQGTLVVNGRQPNSPIGVLAAGTLRGIGEAGHLNVFGVLAPGDNFGSLTSEDILFHPGSQYRVNLSGTDSENAMSRLDAYGSVDLTGASLEVDLGFAPPVGHEFMILRKQGGPGITGTFTGLPEGTVFLADGIPFHITYAGGNGNDVVLTVADLPLRIAATRLEGGNGNGRIDPDECDDLFVTIENTGGLPFLGVTARLDALDPRIAVTQAESIFGNIPALGFGTNRAPFQIRIASGYPCTSAADLHLVIHRAGNSPFALPLRLLTGVPGSSQTVQSTDVPQVIPDLGVAQSVIDWTNGFFIGQVRVRLHATHPAAGQLRFRLRAPWGDEVLLAANRGGNADNYGINCARQTVFDPDAPTSIAAGSAPFEGTFAPEGDFAPFINRLSGGVWTLVAEDTVAGGVGTLQCWSLELARAECADGGGGCESCTTQVEGVLSPASQTMPGRLAGTASPSGCGNPKPCPKVESGTVGPYRYHAHSFTNQGPDTCVTVVLYVPCGAWSNGLCASAYLNDFDPGNLCVNYLGDIGQRIYTYFGEGSAFSFPVPAGQRFTVVVNEANTYTDAGQGCGTYRLELFGLPCPEARPRLHIANDAGPDKVRLHWSTAYPGFQLQGTPGLGGLGVLAFTNVAAAPMVVAGQYTVTNSHTRTNNGFFRLRKP